MFRNDLVSIDPFSNNGEKVEVTLGDPYLTPILAGVHS